MFGQNCAFCGCDENKYYADTKYLCKNCVEIKKIIDLYTCEDVVETLKFIYLRDAEPLKNRRNVVKNSDKVHPKK